MDATMNGPGPDNLQDARHPLHCLAQADVLASAAPQTRIDLELEPELAQRLQRIGIATGVARTEHVTLAVMAYVQAFEHELAAETGPGEAGNGADAGPVELRS